MLRSIDLHPASEAGREATLAVRYVRVEACPSCGSQGRWLDTLAGNEYRFGHLRIAHPKEGVLIRQCQSCQLVYKDRIPHPDDGASIIRSEGARVWAGREPKCVNERDLVTKWAPKGVLDVLDVGGAGGALLRALAEGPGRRSYLDVMVYPDARGSIHGEAIVGSLESDFTWSEYPYAIVTAFDVLEHVADARRAFDRLASLVRPGGVLIVHTGDWTHSGGRPNELGRWSYLRLFEHNVCWSARSATQAANARGLSLIHAAWSPHKNSAYSPLWKKLAITLFRQAARVDAARSMVAAATGIDPGLIGRPLASDHMTLVFEKSR